MWHDILQLFQWMVSLALLEDKWYTKQSICCSLYSSLQEVWDLGKGSTWGIWKLAATPELKFKFQAHLEPNTKLQENAALILKKLTELYGWTRVSTFLHLFICEGYEFSSTGTTLSTFLSFIYLLVPGPIHDQFLLRLQRVTSVHLEKTHIYFSLAYLAASYSVWRIIYLQNGTFNIDSCFLRSCKNKRYVGNNT